jgi:hypothetical protein
MKTARPMIRALLLAALALAPLAALADPGSEAKSAYRLESDRSTSELKAGEQGKLVVVIRPTAPGWHIHPEAPLKVRFESSGLTIEKTTFSRKDAANPGAQAPRFESAFVAPSLGTKEATASFDFFICSDSACVKQSRTLSIPVTVK